MNPKPRPSGAFLCKKKIMGNFVISFNFTTFVVLN